MGTGVLIVAQSGGPTSVINASLVGVVRAARAAGRPVFGARFGFEGLLSGDFVDFARFADRQLAVLARTPAAALGSSRERPSDAELERALDELKARNVRWLVMIGGNDSAEIMHRLHLAATARGQELPVVGVPKTVDNDLPGMDHTPGYGSTARFIALAVRGTALDSAAMRGSDPVKIIEVAGRNSGWLAAASALARNHPHDPPHVIFLPERTRSLDQMVADVGEALASAGYAVVVIGENQRAGDGAPLAGGDARHTDAYGHPYHDSPGQALAGAIRANLRVVARYEHPGSIARSLSGQSSTDLREAQAVGEEAARLAIAGATDVMVAIQREPGPEYRVRLDTLPLEDVAGRERRLPDEFIAPSGIDVTAAFLSYARPLIGAPLPAILTL